MMSGWFLLLIAAAELLCSVDAFSPLCGSHLSSSSVTRNYITSANTETSLSAGKSSIQNDKNSALESSVSGIVQRDVNAISPVKFDLSLAVILAGYSFEAYNEPVREADSRHCKHLSCRQY